MKRDFSRTEPSSVILSQTVAKKLKRDITKVPKQTEAKRDGEYTPKITISINFNTENVDALEMLRIN